MGTMAGGAAPLQNAPKQTVESPMMESEPLLNDASVKALGGLIDKAKDKFQANKEANAAADAELHDLIFGISDDAEETTQNPFDPASQESGSNQSLLEGNLQDLGEGMSDEKLSRTGEEINTLYKEAQKRAKKNNSSSDAEIPSDMIFDLNAQKTGWSQSLKNYFRNHSKTYRNYEGLTPIEAGQKWASKFLTPLTAREYYGLASELHDDGKPAKKRLRDNDFYKLDDIHNDETRQLIQKNMMQNLELDPNDPATYEKIKDMNVVVPKTSSHLYKLVKNSDELADFVANHYEELTSNPGKMVKDSLEYKKQNHGKILSDILNSDNKIRTLHDNLVETVNKDNLYTIINKADVGGYMNSDGSMTIIPSDVYDFDHMDTQGKKGFDRFIANINNTAFRQQEKGQLSKYSLALPITLSKEEVQAILKLQEQKLKK